MLLYGSHAAYRCLRLIAAIDAVGSDAETVAGCSNTLVRGVQNGMQLAMLVSYMPLAALAVRAASGL